MFCFNCQYAHGRVLHGWWLWISLRGLSMHVFPAYGREIVSINWQVDQCPSNAGFCCKDSAACINVSVVCCLFIFWGNTLICGLWPLNSTSKHIMCPCRVVQAAAFCLRRLWRMGRTKGIVEVRMEMNDVEFVSNKMLCSIPTILMGQCSVSPTKLFGGFASNSVLNCIYGSL